MVRYLLITLPLFLMVLAGGISSFRPRSQRIFWSLAVVLPMLFPLVNYLSKPSNEDLRSAGATINKHHKKGDVILMAPTAAQYGIMFYTPYKVRSLGRIQSVNLRDHDRLWFVIVGGKTAEQKIKWPQTRGWLETRGHKVIKKWRYKKIQIYLYALSKQKRENVVFDQTGTIYAKA